MELPWFKRYSDRYKQELDELESAGVSYKIDEEAKKNGYLRLELSVPNGADTLELIATFPISYPYFRPQVQATNLSLPRHQHPFGKNLCLIPRPTRHWEAEWTLNAYLQNQLKKVLETGKISDLDKISNQEYEQAEPFSDYYKYQPETVVFIDSDFEIDKEIKSGKIVVGYPKNSTIVPKVALLRVKDSKGNIIHKLPSEIGKFFPREVEYSWYLLEEPLKVNSASVALKTLHKKIELKGAHKSESVKVKKGQIENIVGLAFPEEHSLKEKGTGWIFIISVKQNKKKKPVSYFSPAKRVGKKDMFARIPELTSLQEKKISIAGLGCLGAPAAIELAKAGIGELFFIDHDLVDPATIVRWPLGIQSSGSPKVVQISNFINQNFPYTRALGEVYKIGAAFEPLDSFSRESKIVESFFDNTSLIFDATAEIGVNHYLSQISKKQKLPYVCIYGTNNGWGGVVLRIIPNKTEGCWMCFRYALYDETIKKPAEDTAKEIQPTGCADPTFTGSSFDLSNISLAGVRLAVSTLCSETENGYPDMDWDVGIVSFRDGNGKPIAPNWEIYQLNTHPKCPYCN